MAEILIYTSALCGFCYSAKRLFADKGVEFTEIDVTFGGKKRAEMSARAGGQTSVPQIWIGGEHIGGSDELYALEADGRLDPLLKRPA
ncbi:MAG: glutaredoxin 3 [Alphaproteobacteria bacterium]